MKNLHVSINYLNKFTAFLYFLPVGEMTVMLNVYYLLLDFEYMKFFIKLKDSLRIIAQNRQCHAKRTNKKRSFVRMGLTKKAIHCEYNVLHYHISTVLEVKFENFSS